MIKVKKKTVSNQVVDLKEIICPLFVKEGDTIRESIVSMPGIYKFSPDTLIKEVAYLRRLGLKTFLIFGVPIKKDWKGTYAYSEGDVVSETVRLLKKRFSDLTIITDVCLCAYASHGHCGIIDKGKKNINNPKTLKALSDIALLHAQAGADYVAPSAMAAGQVRAIRKKLDTYGFSNVRIMGYSAKFASNFYGPFRDIADSAPRFGDRQRYQLNYIKREPAIEKILKDIDEGADVVMVKPGLGYLDIVREAKSWVDHPLAVYNVSGEYAMIKSGAKGGTWDEKMMVLEIMTAMKRAGADFIITYHAKDIARWLGKK